MTPYERLLRMFDYDAWANLKILALLEEHDSFEYREKVLGLFGHIIGSQQMWYERSIGGDPTGIEVWPDYEIDEFRDRFKSGHDKLQGLLKENREDLDRVINYRNSSGTSFETPLSDILHHLVVHGQHHRAQIGMLLRMSNIAPPATDFIFYTRETG